MASDLIVGPLDADLQKHIIKLCKRIGLKNWPLSGARFGWFSELFDPRTNDHAGKREAISVLNPASLNLFNEFAAGLAKQSSGSMGHFG